MAAIHLCLLLVALLLVRLSFTAKLHAPNRRIARMLHLRTPLLFLDAGAVGAVIYGLSVEWACVSKARFETAVLILTLVIDGITLLVALLSFCLLRDNTGAGDAAAVFLRCLRRVFRRRSVQMQNSIIDTVSLTLAGLSARPSDVLGALLLVRSMQLRDMRQNEKTLLLSDEKRAEKPSVAAKSAAVKIDVTASIGVRANVRADAHEPLNVRYYLPEAVTVCATRDATLREIARRKQPILLRHDRQRLALARALSPYANRAIYGLGLHVFENILFGACQQCCWGCCVAFENNVTSRRHGSCSCIGANLRVFCHKANLRPDQLVLAHFGSDIWDVSFAVCVCDVLDTRALVVTFRGTNNIGDVLTDLQAEETMLPEEVQEYLRNSDANLREISERDFLTHGGILAAARQVRARVFGDERVREVLSRESELPILLTGHSLGAGASALLALILRASSDFENHQVHAVCFGSPAVLSSALTRSAAVRSLVTSVVHRDDMIPRMSLHSILKLKRQMTLALLIAREHGLSQADVIRESRRVRRIGTLRHARRRSFSERASPLDELIADRRADEAETETETGLTGETGSSGLTGQGQMPLCPPGCTYLLLTAKLWNRRKTEKQHLVMRAAPECFSEILVTSKMFAHHMPNRYAQVMEELSLQQPAMFDADNNGNNNNDISENRDASNSLPSASSGRDHPRGRGASELNSVSREIDVDLEFVA
ncbi:MAG: hypothetical protein MHM6MM_002802 [Cercozoa sp. M6MM]